MPLLQLGAAASAIAATAVSGAERPAASGYYTHSRCFAVGVTSHGLGVTVAWGAFDENEARLLTAAWRRTLDGPMRDSLVDVTGLVMSDAAAFATMRDMLESSRDARARAVRRQAIVASDNFGGLHVRGYLTLFPPPYELRDFADRGQALAWLGHTCCANDITEMEATREDLLARLRDWLDTSRLADASIDRAAVELHTTARTLQRRLSAAGTRFTAELARAQVARAQRLMRDPSYRLATIATEVGCATPSTFSDLFRRIIGETPSQWRRRLA